MRMLSLSGVTNVAVKIAGILARPGIQRATR